MIMVFVVAARPSFVSPRLVLEEHCPSKNLVFIASAGRALPIRREARVKVAAMCAIEREILLRGRNTAIRVPSESFITLGVTDARAKAATTVQKSAADLAVWSQYDATAESLRGHRLQINRRRNHGKQDSLQENR